MLSILIHLEEKMANDYLLKTWREIAYNQEQTQEQYNQYKIFESWLLIFAPVMSLCLWRSVECAKYDVKEKFNEYVSSVQTLSYLSISIFFVIFLIFRKQAEALCGMNDFMLLIAFLYTYAHTSNFYKQRRENQMMRYKASTTLTAATDIPTAEGRFSNRTSSALWLTSI